LMAMAVSVFCEVTLIENGGASKNSFLYEM